MSLSNEDKYSDLMTRMTTQLTSSWSISTWSGSDRRAIFGNYVTWERRLYRPLFAPHHLSSESARFVELRRFRFALPSTNRSPRRFVLCFYEVSFAERMEAGETRRGVFQPVSTVDTEDTFFYYSVDFVFPASEFGNKLGIFDERITRTRSRYSSNGREATLFTFLLFDKLSCRQELF